MYEGCHPGYELSSTDIGPRYRFRACDRARYAVTRSTASGSATGIETPVVHASPAETARLFEALDSEACRAVVRVLDDGPMTAKELEDAGDIPLSTVYRCVNELVDTPLIEETTRVNEGGHHASEYSRPVETVVVSFGSESPAQGVEAPVLKLTI